jgi:ectoine hydroxylase-related dioxygenase (phytanoyl-CoA dioxygenase family)
MHFLFVYCSQIRSSITAIVVCVMPLTSLSAEQIDFYNQNGWLITDLFDRSLIGEIKTWINEVQSWDDNGAWLNHYEATDNGAQKCRTEYFTPFHPQLRAMLCDGTMLEVASALLGEQAVLYKEKINYKLAGGAGWDAHQDAPAYPFLDLHISCMVAIDDANEENGCLEIVSKHHHELIPTDSRGCIPRAVEAKLDWQAVPLLAGQTMWFHSRTPHRSGDNKSSRNRRAMYPTYNAASEGDLREKYYETKRAELAHSENDANGGAAKNSRVQISLIDDFRGKPVTK